MIKKIIQKLKCFIGTHYHSIDYFDENGFAKQCEYCFRIKRLK